MATHKATKAAGDLDPSFGDEGKVLFTLAQGPFRGSSKLLNDGKILTAGFSANDVVLVRHLSNGEVDDSFGDHGIKRINLIPGVPVVQAGLTLDSNGNALIFGSVGEPFEEILYFIRTLPDGKLDTTFGREGRVFIDLPAGSDVAHAVAIQPDGKIVLAARAERDFEVYDEVLLRLDSKGHLDPTFGRTGMVFVGKVYFSSVIVLPDGKLLLAGSKNGVLLFARYLSDGQADASFGENGFVTLEIKSSTLAQFSGAMLQRDGKIVAVGYAFFEQKGFRPLTTRVSSDGSLDNTFNHGAPAIIGFEEHEVQNMAVAIQLDDKIIAVGQSLGSVETANFTLMRFLPNGALDTEFGSHGRLMTNLGGLDSARGVSLQSDGKIVVSGTVVASPRGTGQGIARYLS
ncbi:hypothetical protein [Pseudomonas batumici]|uniref:RTX toxin, Ca2+-binding protein n=1 Tax=Pseudomonas batumici TaxID=226910 RepID=A0A0C2ETC3_9PSED|nr:hypothetical protein [Pseudomonas batumici]KIH81783.1 RTX toxin, Ca2+-binding protein [Pseudomonas batumici]